ncbi:type I thyroxine 5'-deiodinase [Desulfoluna spongiiphila]|uniref:Type I thyroxine 5'-deiodinase n=1 Tax=Desulfoluna spongiiphila TaxID=419481 RepID=A0A1G5J360_9BACT|nr:type I thyroxine 5'-deiodinase [Desulfoluna spongiiphila]
MRFLPVYKKYRDDVDFMMIYVREAHPTDKWWLAETKFMRFVSVLSNPYPSYDTREPRTIEERRAVATACKAKLLDDMPVYVDDMDNSVNQAYVGWPTRIYCQATSEIVPLATRRIDPFVVIGLQIFDC